MQDLITDTFHVTIPDQYGLPINWSYGGVAYLCVLYENPLLPKVNACIFINNQNYKFIEEYNFTSLNPINITNPVGFAMFSDRYCYAEDDGSYIYVNNYLLGYAQGIDSVNYPFSCAGVQGHFYYQNNTLFGLDDDTPDSLFNGTDVLADIKSYLNNQTTIFNALSSYGKDPPVHPGNLNMNIGFSLCYTTPCNELSTVVSKDTTICRGDTVTLFAGGGKNYTWWPKQGLTDSTIYNPVASPDSTTNYIVIIKDSLGCAKTEHVRVTINNLPKPQNITKTNCVCGNNDGTITLNNVIGGKPPYIYTLNDSINQTQNIFNNLQSNYYNISVIDSNGCKTDTMVFVNEINNVNALYSSSVLSGTVPLNVNFTNESTNANNYMWLINNDTLFTQSADYIFDSAGTYSPVLIAWNNIQQCADTFYTSIDVQRSIVIPGIFSPNNDGKNDTFEILRIDDYSNITLEIFNRWGDMLYNFDGNGKQYSDKTNQWNGKYKGKNLPMGPYIYILTLENKEKISGIVSIVR